MADAHHEEEHIHMPAPSIWPFILVLGVGHLPIAALLFAHSEMLGVGTIDVFGHTYGLQWLMATGALLTGVAVSLVGAMGWASSIIKEKYEIDTVWGNRVLSQAWKLFLLSEAAIFGSFFGHYYYMLYKMGGNWPPAGTPHIDLIIPAVGTGILVTSSLTCELAHKALIAGRRQLCKNWLILTLALGFIFLGMQAWEWGHLISKYNFTPTTNVFGTIFYMVTGFHGFHVITGVLFLFVVYARLEMGAFDRKRHFSMNAASWYWHFVDVIWLLVFFTLYVGSQHAP